MNFSENIFYEQKIVFRHLFDIHGQGDSRTTECEKCHRTIIISSSFFWKLNLNLSKIFVQSLGQERICRIANISGWLQLVTSHQVHTKFCKMYHVTDKVSSTTVFKIKFENSLRLKSYLIGSFFKLNWKLNFCFRFTFFPRRGNLEDPYQSFFLFCKLPKWFWSKTL